MKFRLLYEGPIAPWKKGNVDTIHDIRRKVDPPRPAPEVVKVVHTFVEEINNRARVATTVGAVD